MSLGNTPLEGNLLNINRVIRPNTPSNTSPNESLSNPPNNIIPDSISPQDANSPVNIAELNNIIKNNVSPRYKIIHYLGEGVHGYLYLVQDMHHPSKRQVILKRIPLNSPSPNTSPEIEKNISSQINLELNILKYLSTNQTTREFINPCLDYKIINNSQPSSPSLQQLPTARDQSQILTFFPVFKGYSLGHLTRYLQKLPINQYYKIVFHLIKNILFAMSNIHKTHIAHQNISENSILVSTVEEPRKIKVKLTDFGLGCNSIPSPHIQSSQANLLSPCTAKGLPVKITPDILATLTDRDYLLISQKHDLFCLGVIFLKLLLRLFNPEMNITQYRSYTPEFIRNVKQGIIKQYLEGLEDLKMVDMPDSFKDRNIKRDLLEYLRLLDKMVLCPIPDRQSCDYVLDKIIIYEKYKNDII